MNRSFGSKNRHFPLTNLTALTVLSVALSASLIAPTSATASTTKPATTKPINDKYTQAQSHVNYLVYRPSNVATLPLKSFQITNCGTPLDQQITATYGSATVGFTLSEVSTSSACMSSTLLAQGQQQETLTKAGRAKTTKPVAHAALLDTNITIVYQGISVSQLAAINKGVGAATN